jgi:predicted ATPase/transcriptional regulator with XRE-family HTH domain/Tfp pilus assembly protein PilF
MTDLTFGEWLKRRRGALGLTQEQLAQQVGCSTIALRKIEAEERRPSLQIAERLADVLGVETQDRSAFLRFTRGDWQAAPTTSRAAIPWQKTRSNLPAPLTSFIGREDDIALVRDYLLDSGTRLVTLIGSPGIGKTRLSLQVAHDLLPDFVDGVFFVPLAPIEDHGLVAPTILQTLGLRQTDQRSALDCLKDGINDRQMLIVLDNFEQVVEAAPLTVDLLRTCPNLKIMVTSRESLRVPGEWLYLVPPLISPDETQLKSLTIETADRFSALNLFAERARAVRPDFALTPANTLTVAGICRQLDGLPLAIELIASRIRLMSPQELSAHLTSDFKLHADGMRGVPPRQKTLHNAIAWSYARLSRAEQTLLARLSVFVGGFTFEAAQAVVQLPGVIHGVMSLLDKSLLTRKIDAQGKTRFNQLEMIREYAHEKLDESDEKEQLRLRHRDFFISFAEQAAPKLKGAEQFEWLDCLEIEHDNLRTAWTCAIETDTELALRLASALVGFWSVRGDPSEGREWFLTLLERTAQWGPTAERAHVLAGAGWLVHNPQDSAVARDLLEQALVIARTSGDKKEIAFALQRLGYAFMRHQDTQTAQAFLEECLMLYRELQDQYEMAATMVILGMVAADQGHQAEAEEQYLQSLAQFQALGEKYRVGLLLTSLGELARLQGNYARAGTLYEQSIEILREFRKPFGLSFPLFNLAWVSLHSGDSRKAQVSFEESLRLSKEYGDRMGMAECVAGFAAIRQALGKPEEGARLFGAAEAVLEGIDRCTDPIDQKEVDHYVAAVRAQLSEAAFAAAWAAGRALTLEQAIALALQETD